MGDITINAGQMSRNPIGEERGLMMAQKPDNKKTVFGGNLNMANDPVMQKRKEAQQKAWNVVQKAWDNDQAVDESINTRKAHYTEMEEKKKAALDGLSEISEEREVLKTLYEVDDDSEEQKDLEILEKKQNWDNGLKRGNKLTAEEKERYNEIVDQPRTEYQKRMLEWNDQAAALRLDLEDAVRQMRDDDADIRSIQKERLKHHPMVDAQKEAKAIHDAAAKEIIGMLIDESKDHVDEQVEEAKEEADEAMEAKEDREERLEDLKELRAMQKAVIEGTKEALEEAKAEQRKNDQPDIEITDMVEIARGSSHSGDVQQSLDDIKNSMKVLEADLKGIQVDEEV